MTYSSRLLLLQLPVSIFIQNIEHFLPYFLFFIVMFWLVFFCITFFFSEQHLYYVFCLLKLDGQVLDTALVETDESETDISFDNIIVLYVFTFMFMSTPAYSLHTIFWKLKRCDIKLSTALLLWSQPWVHVLRCLKSTAALFYKLIHSVQRKSCPIARG